MLALLKQLWAGRGERPAVMTLPKDQRQDALNLELKEVFDSSKKFSDFLAMVVRMSFTALALIYFVTKTPTASPAYAVALAICAVAAFASTMMMGLNITKIIVLWIVDGAIHLDSITLRIGVLLLTLVLVGALLVGMVNLAFDIARTSSLVMHAS